MEALHVFLSHAHQDKPFADALVHALRGGGANVWYDEHNLGTGQLLDEITRELRARPVFVVLLSKDAFASAWVKQECRWAFNLYNREPGRIILPVTVEKIEPADFDAVLYLEDFKRVEAPGFKPYERGEACTRTLRALTLTPAGSVPVPAVPQPAESLDDLLTQGKALIGKKQYAAAIPFFERATRLDVKNSEAWANLAYSLDEVKRYEEALAAYDR
ncbi:MAG TPA: TIR domain-containing protein, partial [Ktedonobacterales bacterium]|nr:TIR domain-containing protein [Ktedonobacterales bacterium]